MRVKRSVTARKRHKKVFRLTKGFKLGRKNIYRLAKQAAIKAGQYSYRDRRSKKREFRRLWIVQLNAAVRLHGLNYRDFIAGLKKTGLALNRKVLARLSAVAPAEFTKIIESVKLALKEKK